MSYNSNEYDDLVIAALLHDIGKFYQRADSKQPEEFKDSKIDFGYSGAHSKWSSQFVLDKFGKDNDIKNLILYHHNAPDYPGDKNFINLIKKADSSSAYERNNEQDEEKDPKKEPLISIFSEVNLNENDNDKYYMDLVELTLEDYKNLFAHKQKKEAVEEHTLEPKYKLLWKKFSKEFDLINNLNDIETILNLLKKYTLFVPSAAYKSEPDISLYDHLRTTAAIGSARYNYILDNGKITKTSDNKENYLVINASISGIQDFIYKINSPSNAQRGMAKRLRGRSFYLSLLMESIAYYMIKELNLKTPNLLYSSGGKFTILAHNSDKTIKKLEEIEDKINKFLIETFNSDIYFSLVYQETTDADFKNFGEITQILANKTNSDKKHKFIGQLNEIFEIERDISYEKQCSVCGNLTNDNICSTCEEHQLLGTKLANSDYMIRYYSENKIGNSIYFDILNIGYFFLENDEKIIDKINDLLKCEHLDIIRINDTNFLELSSKLNSENISYSFKFIGNNVPEYDNENITFEEIAKKSTGSNRLAIAKMDVDNLGQIFARGLENPSISRIASLSFYLDIFFGGIINKIAKQYDVYINYSGGDDLLVIGAYDKIIEFSMQLQKEFKEYTCCNDSINISAGISVVKPKFPISKAIKFADDNLEKSKELGKNKITLFNETINWQSKGNSKIYGLDNVIEFSKQVEKYITDGKLSKSFVYSLNIFKKQYFTTDKQMTSEADYNTMINKRIKTKKYIPLFKYKLRNISDKDVFNFLDEKLSKEHYMPWIQIILNWVMLRTR